MCNVPSRKFVVAFLGLALAFAPASLKASDPIWTADTDGNWSDAANWFEGLIPATSGSDVVFNGVIDSSAGVTSTIDSAWSSAGSVNSLTFLPGIQSVDSTGTFTLGLGGGVGSFTVGADGLTYYGGRSPVALPNPVLLGANQTWKITRVVSDPSQSTTAADYAPRILISNLLNAASAGTQLTLQSSSIASQIPATNPVAGQIHLLGASGTIGSNVDRLNLAGTFIRLGADATDSNFNRIANSTTIASYGGSGLIVFRQGSGTEDLGNLRLEAGMFSVRGGVTGGSGTSVYRFASLAHRGESATLLLDSGTNSANQINFQFADATGINTGTNGIMGGWAVGVTQQAGIRFLAPATNNTTITTVTGTNAADSTALNAATGTSNLNLTVGTSYTLDANRTLNSLRFTVSNTILDLGGNTLRIGTGGVIVDSPGVSRIQNGNLTVGASDNTPGTLYWHQRAAGNNSSSLGDVVIADNGDGVVNVVYSGNRGGGITTIGGDNTYTGFTAITGGVSLSGTSGSNWFGATPASFVADKIRITDGAINANGGRTISENFGIQLSGAGLSWDQQAALTNIDSAISGTGGFTLLNSDVNFRGSMSNTYTGDTVVSALSNVSARTSAILGLGKTDGATAIAGNLFISLRSDWNITESIVRLNAGNQIANTSVVTLLRPGTTATTKARLQLNGFSETIGGLNGSADIAANAVVENTHASTASTLTIAPVADSYYSFGGVLQNQDAAGGGALNVVINGAASGRQVFSGANTYTGTTMVTAGTLLINGNQSTATGDVTVAPAGTLGGSGTIGGNVFINGGTLSPGNSAGTLTLNNTDLTITGTASAIAMEINGTSAGQFDRVIGIDAFGLDGALTITLSGTYAINDSWNLFGFASKSGNFEEVTLAGSYTGSLTRSGDLWSGSDIGGLNWQFSEASGMLSVIPEPSTAGLLAVGLLSLLLRRRRG